MIKKNDAIVGSKRPQYGKRYEFHTQITGTSLEKQIVFDITGRSETTADDENR
jgi:hypothetical protein